MIGQALLVLGGLAAGFVGYWALFVRAVPGPDVETR